MLGGKGGKEGKKKNVSSVLRTSKRVYRDSSEKEKFMKANAAPPPPLLPKSFCFVVATFFWVWQSFFFLFRLPRFSLFSPLPAFSPPHPLLVASRLSLSAVLNPHSFNRE